MSTVTLPWPPAVNNLFFTAGKHRVRSSRYNAWIAQALTSVCEQRPHPVHGSFTATIVCHAPDRRKRDLDGLMKAPLDLLVKAGVIQDDSLARLLTIGWALAEPCKPGQLTITLEAA